MAGARLVIPNADPIYESPGVPAVGAIMYIYNTGTTDFASIYAEASLETALTNPQVADANGLFYEQATSIYVDASDVVDVFVETPNGTTYSYIAVSGITQAEGVDGYAPINSPLFTGNPRAPTPPLNDNSQSIATTAFVKSYVDAALANATPSVPPGSMLWWGSLNIPSGYLRCDGQAVSRTTYSALFTAIGTTFGAGDSITTFNVPNMSGKFVRGLDSVGTVDPGRSLGSNQDDAFKAHVHPMPSLIVDVDLGGVNRSITQSGATTTVDTNSTGGSETRPKNVALVLCIKT